jgi:hypothetical protein
MDIHKYYEKSKCCKKHTAKHRGTASRTYL